MKAGDLLKILETAETAGFDPKHITALPADTKWLIFYDEAAGIGVDELYDCPDVANLLKDVVFIPCYDCRRINPVRLEK